RREFRGVDVVVPQHVLCVGGVGGQAAGGGGGEGALGVHVLEAGGGPVHPPAGRGAHHEEAECGHERRDPGQHAPDQHAGLLPPVAQQQICVLLGAGPQGPVPASDLGVLRHRLLHVGEASVAELHVLPGVGAQEPVVRVQGEDDGPVGEATAVRGEQLGGGGAGVIERRIVQRGVLGGVVAVLGHVQDQHHQ